MVIYLNKKSAKKKKHQEMTTYKCSSVVLLGKDSMWTYITDFYKVKNFINEWILKKKTIKTVSQVLQLKNTHFKVYF